MHFSLLSSNFRFSKDVFLEKLINHLKDAKRYVLNPEKYALLEVGPPFNYRVNWYKSQPDSQSKYPVLQ